MELRDLKPHGCSGRQYVAVVANGDGDIAEIEIELSDNGLALTDSIDSFELRFPTRARALCGAIYDVLEGKKQLPVDF